MKSFKQMIRQGLFRAWRILFARPYLYKFNRIMLHLCLRSLGVLNYESDAISGETAFLKRVLTNQKGKVVLDVGAHRGRYAVEVMQLAPTMLLHAFEPHPKTFVELRELAATHDFFAHNVGCAAQAGTLKLYDYADQISTGTEHASLVRAAIEDIAQAHSAAIDVQLVTVDAFCSNHAIDDIHLLKIDAEGYELEILKGAKGLIDQGNIDIIQFEFNSMNVFSRVFMRDFFDILPNYRLFRLLPNDILPLHPYDPMSHEIFAYQNIAAIRNGVTI